MDNERALPFTVKELAEAAGVHVSYIRQLLQTGKLDGYKQGRDWFVPVDVGRAWLASRRERWEKF